MMRKVKGTGYTKPLYINPALVELVAEDSGSDTVWVQFMSGRRLEVDESIDQLVILLRPS